MPKIGPQYWHLHLQRHIHKLVLRFLQPNNVEEGQVVNPFEAVLIMDLESSQTSV